MFEHFERTLSRASRVGNDGYPPYNIEKTGEHSITISIAVAGFTKRDLEIVVELNQLIVWGRKENNDGRVYLHRGIASRKFQRAFVLADGIEVQGAHLSNGLLNIDLVRPVLEIVPETVEIRESHDHKDRFAVSKVRVNVFRS